ncbi:MAG: PLP-dependent aspartate aminotransferase family protein [Candidatus Aminicenantes bacterium]|nr:PLP-dependent aspartate aminotransferase family protein [Candidatus Aminicenantes bacterium]
MSDAHDHSELNRGLATRAVHAGEPEPRIEGAVSIPVFQSATFETAGEESYEAVRYVRLNNTPNHQALHAKLASLEGGEAAVVASSGMAAITTTLLALLSHGDHLLALEGLYGGTHTFVTRDLAEFGIGHDLMDGNRPETWSALLKPSTRAIYVEAITNPLMQVPDLERLVRFARKHGLVSIIDSTFATPVNYRPVESGFDLVVHSGTKYLNGHSDLAAGAVIGPRELVRRVTHRLNHLGGVLDPHACYLLHRGLKTLVLRVGRQNGNALALARFLEAHPAIEGVNYPGLETHPQHGRARQLFSGFGGMLSFEARGGIAAAESLLNRLRIPRSAPSLGGVETLITRPATTSHAGVPPSERIRMGISDSLVRVSVGIEDPGDLVEDFEQGLEGIS